MHPKCFSKYFFCDLFPLATPQVTFRALAKPRIWRAASYSPPAWLSSNHLPPALSFCLFAHPPFLIPFLTPFPHTFHVSNICLVSCSPPRSLSQTPNPVPFYFASCPLVLFSFLCFSARTHARFPQPCYVPFDTYMSITSCMFLSLKLT